jgi:hypothetical protein
MNMQRHSESSEDDLQTVAHHLKLMARKYIITISSTITKSMKMWGTTYRGYKL